jgi:hypothetical protein
MVRILTTLRKRNNMKLINFKEFKYLQESKEISVATPEKISGVFLETLQKFQTFVSLIPIKEINENNTIELLKTLEPFRRYKFAKEFLKEIEEYLSSINVEEKSIHNFPSLNKFILKFKEGKIDEIFDDVSAIRSHAETYISNLRKKAKMFYKGSKIIKRSTPFTRMGIFDEFTKEDLSEVSSKDLSKFCYSYIFPKLDSKGNLEIPSHTSTLEFYFYIIKKLKDTPKPIRLDTYSFEIYKRILDSKFEELRSLVMNYMKTNDKSEIEKIKALITPDIRKSMLKVLRGKKQVYRGIGFFEEDREDITEESIKEMEKKIRYVSTSPNYSMAMRFAKGQTQFDSSEVTRNLSYILTYDISSKDSVILDTSIFGQVFNETDVLIDVEKAKLISIDKL